MITGDREGLSDNYAASNRVPGLWFGSNDVFMVSSGIDNQNYFQTFYPYVIGMIYHQKSLLFVDFWKLGLKLIRYYHGFLSNQPKLTFVKPAHYKI